MPNYHRAYQARGCYFFTVNLQQRYPNDLLVRHIDVLRAAFRDVVKRHPFRLDAIVILPDHLHCVLTLPADDVDYPTRWRLIKSLFSRKLSATEPSSDNRRKRYERNIWQRRYWEHLIRDERDWRAHIDYVHINPQHHGYVTQVADWPFSTFHRYVQQGIYPVDWGGSHDTFTKIASAGE